MKTWKIYVHINKINGKAYVGQTVHKNPQRRWDYGKGYKHSSKFYNAIKKYGWDNFEHIIICECRESEVDELERKYIIEYDSIKNGYNCDSGGNKNKILSEEHKRKIGLANKGRKPSREAIEKGRLKRIGRKSWNSGMKMSDEHRKKLSEAHKGQKPWIAGKHHSLETKIKSSRPVLQFDSEGNLVAEYYGTVEAEKHTGIDNSNIVRCCCGKRRKAGGFIWKYKE